MSNNNKTNDPILNLTPENIIQHSRIELNDDSVIDAKEFHKLQTLYFQVMADVRNVDRKMKVQTEESFQKTILDEIKNLENAMEQN